MPVHKDVRLIQSNFLAFVKNIDLMLRLTMVSTSERFYIERVLVNPFQKTKSQLVVHIKKGGNDTSVSFLN